jgi:signal transduction histidine kinase
MNASRQRTALLALAMVLGAVVANALISYLNIRRLRNSDTEIRHTYEVIAALQGALGTMVDAETGQRGYLVTGEAPFLKPYQDALRRVDRQFKRLHELIGNDAQEAQNLEELEGLAQRRLDELRDALAAYDHEGQQAVEDRLRAGAGKRAMDRVREKIAQMEGLERTRLSARAGDAQIAYWTSITTGVFAAILSLCLAGAAYLLVMRDLAQREKLAAEMRDVNERLEERVRERTNAVHDVIASLRAEIETRRAAEAEAQHVTEELQRSNRELEQFASVASHDLQEPLRKIQAFGDRLNTHAHDELGEKGRDFLERILLAAARMRRLIDDLLAFSRVATKAQPFRPVDLNQIIREVLGDLESRLQQTGGIVEVEPLAAVSADPLQMRQLFQNLIGNALKFQRPGVPPVVEIRGKMEAAPASAPSGSEEANQGLRLCVTVRDNGIGFDAAYRERIFELFQRLHGRNEYEGTGIGLAICKKIVDRHGGTISAEAAPDKGATFSLTLPLADREPGEN